MGGSGFWFLKKKDRSLRLCIDYRQLNKVTIKKTCTLTLIEDLFYQFQGKNYLSKIELRLGYHQFRVRDEDIQKITLQTKYGKNEFLEISYSLKNTWWTIMDIMNRMLQCFLDQFVIVFIDNILIYSKN